MASDSIASQSQVRARKSMAFFNLAQKINLIGLRYPGMAPCLSLGWLLLCPSQQLLAQALPSESVWPGESTPKRGAAVLPSESEWPGTPTIAARQREDLPSESSWPNSASTEPAQKAIDERPHLRLHSRGPIAPVRSIAFSQDGQRLLVGGEDKQVQVWTLAGAGARRPWRFTRTVRWQVQRGPLGHVLAVGTHQNLLAMAGHGAMGGHSEIWLADVATGKWQASLVEPDDNQQSREVIASLQFAQHGGGPLLLSSDLAGELSAWTRGVTGWARRELIPSDDRHYGAATARRLQRFRGFSPLATVGPLAVVPLFRAFNARGIPEWIVSRVPLDGSSKPVPLMSSGPAHQGFVSAIAATPKPNLLASCDGTGSLVLWKLVDRPSIQRIQLQAPALVLSFSDDGRRLLVGMASLDPQKPGGWQVWDTSDPTAPKRLLQNDQGNVRAGCISPDGHWVAVAQGHSVHLQSLEKDTASQRLQSGIPAPVEVAFSQDTPSQIAVRLQAASGSAPPTAWSHVFETTQLQLSGPRPRDESAWMEPDQQQGAWSLKRDGTAEGSDVYWIERRQAGKTTRHGRIRLAPQLDGVPTAHALVLDAQRQPRALAVASSGQGNIYVYKLGDRGFCPILRQFRGHSARVKSLCPSRDQRYLASGSEDGTVRVWKLQDLQKTAINRWGTVFAVEQQACVVSAIREDGPLYFRGMRRGDTILELQWADTSNAGAEENAPIRTVRSPREILRFLNRSSWKTPVRFTYRRGRNLTRSFQSAPSWHPIVSLVISRTGEWAYWTPSGYYDASFEGHRLFGWQFNRGLYLQPDFFLAAQLRNTLERPQIMSRLLDAGSLQGAFQSAQQDRPANPHDSIASAHRLQPEIEIVSPVDESTLSGSTVQIEAEIRIRPGQTLIPPKAFANGVVAVRREALGVEIVEQQGARRVQHRYRWTAMLPSDRRLIFQVMAATDQEAVSMARIHVTRDRVPAPQQPRMYVLAAGINRYQDRQIQSLEFAENNALQVQRSLQRFAHPIYRSGPEHHIALLSPNVTRPMWDVSADQIARVLRNTASPDDLLVIFLSGHGVRDPEDESYYYLTAESQLSDVLARRYGDCLSFRDFSRFADIPCRKLVILDTCHSGAVQSLGQQQLKAAIRSLQDDMMLTLTASQGSQEAAESRNRQLGRFTHRFLEGLRGAADRDRDGVVDLREVVQYVQQTVTGDSAGDPVQQTPTAGPHELLEVTNIPLAFVSPSQAANYVRVLAPR